MTETIHVPDVFPIEWVDEAHNDGERWRIRLRLKWSRRWEQTNPMSEAEALRWLRAWQTNPQQVFELVYADQIRIVTSKQIRRMEIVK